MKKLLSMMAMFAALGGWADVVTNVWIGPDNGNWSAGANWEDGTAPVSGEAVKFALTAWMTVTNDIEGLALAGLELAHGNEKTDNYYLTIYGNAIGVPDSGLLITKRQNLSLQLFCDFTGTGTLEFASNYIEGSSTFLGYAGATAFAGKVVVNGGMLSVTNRLTTIGDSDQATVIPDAITLRNGAQLKNFATDITIPAWQGVTLDNAGGFLCGWSGNGDFTITVDSPITGAGPLVIPNSACKTLLRSTANSWTGGVIIGTMNAPGAYGTGATLVLGAEGAIPSGNAVTVDGRNGATLDLGGTSPTFADFRLVNGAVLTNSSATASTLTAPAILIGGAVAPNISLNGTTTYQVPDAAIWTSPYSIAAGETFSLDGTGGTGGMMFKLNGGTLQFPATAGFMETTNANGSIWIDLKAVGGFQSSAVMASAASASLWPSNTTYYYQTMWYIPADATYSFVKYFDDQAAIAIDGKAIIADSGYSNVAYSYGNFLNAGWHELKMWYFNAIGGVGPGAWGYGIKWASDNSTITASTGKGFTSDTGAFVFTPYAARPIYVGAGGGTLRVTEGTGVSSSAVLLRGGLIQTADNTAGDAVTLDGDFIIGNRQGTIAIFDANVALASGATLTFRDAVWFKRAPADGCVIAPGTVCYLSSATDTEAFRAAIKAAGGILGFCDANDSAYGDTISLSAGETLSCRMAYGTTADGLPILDTANSDGLYINARPISVPEGANLIFQNSARWRQSGAISGAGSIACRGVRDALNFSGDNSAFSGTWTSTSTSVYWHEPANLGSASAKLIIQGGASIGTGGSEAAFPQAVTLSSGALIASSTKATLGSLAIAPTNGAVAINGGILEVNAANLTIAAGSTVNGDGTLLIDTPAGSTYIVPALGGNVTLAFSGTGSIDLRYLGSPFTGILSIASGVTIVSDLQPAANPALWLDPAAPDSLVLASGSSTGVSEWHDVRDGTNGSNYARLYLNSSMPNQKTSGFKSAYAPDLFTDSALRPGVIMDFGTVNSGRWFGITPALTVRTLIYVFGSQNSGGGAPFGCSTDPKGILRGGGMIDNPDKITSALAMFISSAYTIADFYNCEAWLDGVSVNPLTKGYNGSYQIVSLRLAGDQPIDALAKDTRPLTGGQGDGTKRSGGMRYGEMLMYDRALTDSEIAATEAYLRNKWFGITSGNVSSASTITLKTAGSTSINVPNAQLSTSFNALEGDGTLAKTGAGTLAIGDVNGFDGAIQLDEGGLAIGGGELNPAFWADASAASSFGTDDNGLAYWRDKRWDGVSDYIVATQRWATAPVLQENACGGLPVVNMGTLSTTHDRGMQWSARVAAKAIFMLIGSQDSGGTILGTSDTDCRFNRYNFGSYTNPIYSTYCDAGVLAGITRLDGVNVNGLKTGFSGGYQVLTVIPTASVSVGQFAHDREIDATKTRDGGQRLGEVLIFTNTLSSAQVKVIENYLITKWKKGGSASLESQTLGALALGGSSAAARAVSSSGSGTLTIDTLTGSTDFTKEDGGTLCLNDFTGYSGKVTVDAGTLALESAAKSALNDATFWVDASAAGSITYASGSSSEVIRWDDCRANGRYATRSPDATSGSYTNLSPTILANELNGRNVLDFGVWMSNEFLLWSAPITDIKTVFWVIGSQNGGGILLDFGASGSSRDFYRAGAYDNATGQWDLFDTVTKDCPIWGSAATQSTGSQAVINGVTRLNGTAVNGAATGLSGNYDIVSLRTANGVGAAASAFNMDRGRKYRNSTGGQRLAEVIIFERTLSDTETAAIESYLSKKWGIAVAQGTSLASSDSDMSVLLAPGAILALNADGQHVLGTIGGIGTVSGASSVTLSGLESVAKDAPGSALTVDGGFTVANPATWSVTAGDNGIAPIIAGGDVSFTGGGTLTLSNAAALGEDPVLLLSAPRIDGFDPGRWTVSSDNSAKMAYTLTATSTGIYLVAHPKGLLVIFR